MQSSSQSESALSKVGKFAAKTVIAFLCAVQAAILLDEKSWLAFGISILLSLPVFLSKKHYPLLTIQIRVGLFFVGEIAMIMVWSWSRSA